MNKPHKYAEVIKAWADGATIQWRMNWGLNPTKWVDWCPTSGPGFDSSIIFRIKPELKDPGIVCRDAFYRWIYPNHTPTSQQSLEWTAAAKAVIEAYKAGELKDI